MFWKQYSVRKFFGFFAPSFRRRAQEVGRNLPEEKPKIFWPEYCFHVPAISGAFLQDPVA
jgi:hypothetical protein